MDSKSASKPWVMSGLALAGGFYLLKSLRTLLISKDLKGKIVLITGGSKGLGMILARNFAREGAQVAICARNAEELVKAREWILHETGSVVLTIACDVSQRDEVDRMVKRVIDEYRSIDILVNNAGTISVAP